MRVNILARVPLLGKAKTRLAATVGNDKALACYQLMLAHTLNVVKASGFKYRIFWTEAHPDLVDDPNAGLQRGDDLGERMYHCFEEGFQQEFDQQIIIGTDCPSLAISHLQEAKAILDNNNNVLGPSTDGGYFLIGMNELQSGLFEKMPWSTAAVADETRKRFAEKGYTYQELGTLSDVDTAADLAKFPDFFSQLVTG